MSEAENTEQSMRTTCSGDALVGTVFADGYEILSVLGKGGISIVYKARYLPLDQLVAVKVLQAHMASNPTVVQRLRMEAKLAHSLEHPNIVRVLRLHISEEGFPFLVADLVDGRTIQQALLTDGPFSEERFSRIFAQAMDALEHAHNRGIVHRDIKPSNLMLQADSADGEIVKVVDFGIAKLLEDPVVTSKFQGFDTTSGNLFGSPSYMSPEQCTGSPVDGRTDIYSLGCLMYEALTGVAAFKGDTAIDTMFHQINTLPRGFKEVAPGRQISPRLEGAIFSALQKDPEERPQTIGELRELLNAERKGRPARLAPQMHAKRAHRLDRLGRPAIIGAAAIVVAAGAIAVAYHSNLAGSGTAGGDIRPENPGGVIPLQMFNLPKSAFDTGLRLARDGYHDDALAAFRRANELLPSRQRDTPSAVQLNIKKALSEALARKQRFGDELVILQERLPLAQKVSKVEYGMTLYAISSNSLHRDLPAQALAEALKATEVTEEALHESVDGFSNRRKIHRSCAIAWDHLASCYFKVGKVKDSEKALRKALEHNNLYGDPVAIMIASRYLANNLQHQGRHQDALNMIKQWQKLSDTIDPDDHELFLERSLGYEVIADNLDLMGDAQKARPWHAKAVEYALRADPSISGTTPAERLYQQALNFYACNEIGEGDKAWRRSSEIYSRFNNQQAVRDCGTEVERHRVLAQRRMRLIPSSASASKSAGAAHAPSASSGSDAAATNASREAVR